MVVALKWRGAGVTDVQTISMLSRFVYFLSVIIPGPVAVRPSSWVVLPSPESTQTAFLLRTVRRFEVQVRSSTFAVDSAFPTIAICTSMRPSSLGSRIGACACICLHQGVPPHTPEAVVLCRYGVPQSPMKFHPLFDHVLISILETDPQATLALPIGGAQVNRSSGATSDMLVERLASVAAQRWCLRSDAQWPQRHAAMWPQWRAPTFPSVSDMPIPPGSDDVGECERRAHELVTKRIVSLPPQLPHDEFLLLLTALDVAVDPWPFGGGFTTYETLVHAQTPVVSLPSGIRAGRLTQALLQRMALDTPVRESPGSMQSVVRYLAPAFAVIQLLQLFDKRVSLHLLLRGRTLAWWLALYRTWSRLPLSWWSTHHNERTPCISCVAQWRMSSTRHPPVVLGMW